MNKKITIENRQLHCHITYQKRRKTIQLKLATSDTLDIIAPSGYQFSEIESIVLQKSKWILSRIAQLAAIASNPINQSLNDGAKVLYCGEVFFLHFAYTNAGPSVRISNNEIIISLPEEAVFSSEISKQLKEWYVHTAAKWLIQRTSHWSSMIKACPKRISIKDQKTRWGSCSSSGTVSYNWRIIMAPPSVIDYLVIHELCHFFEPNHSHKFWALVENFSPTYRQERTWLKKNGPLLSRIL